ncbi:hypothetical protein SmJEL517_g05204 [Synchytrium microbalum]|uniref:3-beta hydroxysteroid dehydrogenase/isomerase domain-containing protein n=1 Tax=Synchytrium microbalum TaxID=1806994 RepID=A0A507BWH9_9FUNG|nr:uncharacterized protein SmJEL517_g05204 [Synchytrium microbalum]TPX31471.1 hypothetical protein SmJEL517_g05204 [Synchytrium microbalum]
MDYSSLKYIALGIGAATTATALRLHLYNKSLFAVTIVECDIIDYVLVRKALDNRSIQIIYHVAAVSRFMDEFPEQLPVSMTVNVKGTENVIEACRELSIPTLVQTSTSYVCVGKDLNPVFYENENLPYATKPFNSYAKTKALAEQATFAAN